MKKTEILLLTLFLFTFTLPSSACSMFKITQDGKTIVANNEDWTDYNTEIWFEQGNSERFGVAYVGFMNRFPQGAMNEAGLVFDAFTTPFLAIEDHKGKKEMKARDVSYHLMRNFSTVHEVKAYLEGIDLSYLAATVLMFVDKSGEYLIVEGDILSIGNEASYVQSNFVPSLHPIKESIKDIDWYQKGLAHVKQKTPKRSLNYCKSVMSAMQNPTTQYTSIYDLDKGTIRLYHYHNFDDFIELNLADELAQGEHAYTIPTLFEENSEGHNKYLKYNDLSEPTKYFSDLLADQTQGMSAKDIAEFKLKSNLPYLINYKGYAWLYDAKDPKTAIKVFTYGTKTFPKNANFFDSLGEAYFEDKQYDLAIQQYGQSLALNPKNTNAINMLIKIKENKEATKPAPKSKL